MLGRIIHLLFLISTPLLLASIAHATDRDKFATLPNDIRCFKDQSAEQVPSSQDGCPDYKATFTRTCNAGFIANSQVQTFKDLCSLHNISGVEDYCRSVCASTPNCSLFQLNSSESNSYSTWPFPQCKNIQTFTCDCRRDYESPPLEPLFQTDSTTNWMNNL
jgi:hypothetical protein